MSRFDAKEQAAREVVMGVRPGFSAPVPNSLGLLNRSLEVISEPLLAPQIAMLGIWALRSASIFPSGQAVTAAVGNGCAWAAAVFYPALFFAARLRGA